MQNKVPYQMGKVEPKKELQEEVTPEMKNTLMNVFSALQKIPQFSNYEFNFI